MEGLSPQRERALSGDDARYQRVHPPLPHARAAPRLTSHPLLRAARQPGPCDQHRTCTPTVSHAITSNRCAERRERRFQSSANTAVSLSLLRRLHAYHREVRTRRNPALPTERVEANHQDRHVMSRFADPHPAMLFFSLPLGSTCPRPIEMPCPCCKSAFHVRSVVTKLITATHSSALLHDLQSLFRFLAARTMWPACSLNPHS